MIKFKTGDIFLTHENIIVKITNINEELLAESVFNKAITVEIIRTGEELNIAHAFLNTWGIKYLGTNEQAARVLYESTNKDVMYEKSAAMLYQYRNHFINVPGLKRQDD